MRIFDILNKKIDNLSGKYKNYPNNDNILIIRCDGIGDFFIFINTLIKIKKIYHCKKFGIVASKEIIDYVLEKKLCDFGIVFNARYYKYNLIYRFFKNIQLLRGNFYQIINPIYSRNKIIDNLVDITRAPIKIGIKGCYANQTRVEQESLNYIYTSLLLSDPDCINEFDKNNRFVEFLAKEIEESNLLQLINIKENKKTIIIAPCTGRKYRQWGENNYIELIRKISTIKNLKIILVGSKADKATCKKIFENVNSCLEIEDQSGLHGLTGLEELIKKSDLVISGETSLTHMAAYVKTKSICIAGGGHFNRFVPYNEKYAENYLRPITIYEPMNCYGCNWNCTVKENDGFSPMPCIAQISTEKVSILVEKMIKGREYE